DWSNFEIDPGLPALRIKLQMSVNLVGDAKIDVEQLYQATHYKAFKRMLSPRRAVRGKHGEPVMEDGKPKIEFHEPKIENILRYTELERGSGKVEQLNGTMDDARSAVRLSYLHRGFARPREGVWQIELDENKRDSFRVIRIKDATVVLEVRSGE